MNDLFLNEHIDDINNAYWEEELEMEIGIHPSQVIERIEKNLRDSNIQYKDIAYLNWIDYPYVEVSIDSKKYGIFDYKENIWSKLNETQDKGELAMKKYELTDETIVHNGCLLHRIKAVKNFVTNDDKIVHAGDLGGWISHGYNLSQDGNCWIADNAKVYNSARVYDDALVFDEAEIYDYAEVYDNAKVYCSAEVCGHAHVRNESEIFDRSTVCGYALISNNSEIFCNAKVGGNASIYGAKIFGDAIVNDAILNENVRVLGNSKVYGHHEIPSNVIFCGDAIIRGTSDYLHIEPFGITFFRTKTNDFKYNISIAYEDNGISFYDSIDDYINEMQKLNCSNKYKSMLLAIKDYLNDIEREE